MKDFFERLKLLQDQYPSRIDIYPPANPKLIEDYDQLMKGQLDNDLKELYSLTNGFGVVDYCFLSLRNRISADLFDTNSYSELEYEGAEAIIFLGVSGYPDFAYVHTEGSPSKVIMVEEDLYGVLSVKIVAESVREFFEKFLGKVEILLGLMNPKDLISYFDDEEMPDSLNEW